MCSCTYSIHGDTCIHTRTNTRTHVHTHHLTETQRLLSLPGLQAEPAGLWKHRALRPCRRDPLPGLLLLHGRGLAHQSSAWTSWKGRAQGDSLPWPPSLAGTGPLWFPVIKAQIIPAVGASSWSEKWVSPGGPGELEGCHPLRAPCPAFHMPRPAGYPGPALGPASTDGSCRGVLGRVRGHRCKRALRRDGSDGCRARRGHWDLGKTRERRVPRSFPG